MTSFRGVDQAIILQSFENLFELSDRHHPENEYPNIYGRINNLRMPCDEAPDEPPVFEKVEAARNDLELATAIGYDAYLGRLYDLMLYHAINNTDLKGRDLFRDLTRLGVFEGAHSADRTEIDVEVDTYIKAHATASFRLRKAFYVTSMSRDRRAHFEQSRGLDQKPSLKSLWQDAKCFIGEFCDERMNFANLGASSSLRRFGVVLPDFNNSGTPFARIDARTSAQMQIVRAMRPFVLLREFEQMGIGVITDSLDYKDAKLGVSFDCTLRAARALKFLCPELDVVDSRGEPVKPLAPDNNVQSIDVSGLNQDRLLFNLTGLG